MGLALIACSLPDRRRSGIASGICTGFLLILAAGANGWSWGSDPRCPPGPEPQCPINPVTDLDNYFPHPNNCHYYIQCDGSRRPLCRPCSPGTYFSPKNINCVWPLDAACEHNSTTNTDILEPPICVPDKPCTPPATKPDKSTCSDNYFICINGKYEKTNCKYGWKFNPKTKMCQDPHEIEECKPTDCIPPETKSDNSKCSDNYFICINGKYERTNCKYGWKFNPKTKICQDPCEIEECPNNCSKTCEEKERRYYDDCTKQMEVCPSPLKTISQTEKCQDPCQASKRDCCCKKSPPDIQCKCVPVCTVNEGRNRKEVTCPANIGKECYENKCFNVYDGFHNVP